MRYLFLFVCLCMSLPLVAQTVISLDASQRYQTIDGWEGVSNQLVAPTVRDSVLPYLPELIDLAVNDVGINRLRVGVWSGIEDTLDRFNQVIDGTLSYDDFKQWRYYKINDNDDPFVADPKGFQMGQIDDNVTNIIRPFPCRR